MPPNNPEKIKVSNLPLLFAKGNPTSLEMMNLEELQIFTRFVIKCELNSSEPPDLDTIDTPEWWPESLNFSETILMKQKSNRGKLSLGLKNAIRSCYAFHQCAFLIDFCRKLIEHTGGIDNLKVVDNQDGTRSLLKRKDNKLLVTFKSENQDYDKNQSNRKPKINSFSAKSPLKTLDSKRLLWNKLDNTSDPAMSNYADVYLCDTCDKDFDSLQLLMAHEKVCGEAEVIVDEPKAQPGQPVGHPVKAEPLLTYLRLKAKGAKVPSPRKLKESERPKATSYEKFMDIDIASPLGTYIINSSKLRLDQQNPSVRGFQSAQDYINNQELKCPGTIYTLRHSNAYSDIRTKYQIVYKNRKRGEPFVHLYSFTKEQRLARARDIRNGLTPSALRIWRRCQKYKISLCLTPLNSDFVKRKMSELDDQDSTREPIPPKKRRKKNLVEINFDDITSGPIDRQAASTERSKDDSAAVAVASGTNLPSAKGRSRNRGSNPSSSSNRSGTNRPSASSNSVAYVDISSSTLFEDSPALRFAVNNHQNGLPQNRGLSYYGETDTIEEDVGNLADHSDSDVEIVENESFNFSIKIKDDIGPGTSDIKKEFGSPSVEYRSGPGNRQNSKSKSGYPLVRVNLQPVDEIDTVPEFKSVIAPTPMKSKKSLQDIECVVISSDED